MRDPVNRLLGEARNWSTIAPAPRSTASTRFVERDGHRAILIDTAGMRRQRQVRKRRTEALGVYQAIRSP